MRPNSNRVKFAIVSLYAIVLLSVVYACSVGVEIYVVHSRIFGGLRMDVSLLGLAVVISQMMYFIIYFVCAIAFILWFTRAYRNIQILIPNSKFYYKPWAAVVCWFIPVWNLFGPYNIATNLFDKTERFLVSEERMNLRPKYDIVKGWWWALWIISAVVIRISEHYTSKNPFVNLGRFATIFGILISILCAFFAIQMIRNYREMEQMMLSVDGTSGYYSLSEDDLLDSGI